MKGSTKRVRTVGCASCVILNGWLWQRTVGNKVDAFPRFPDHLLTRACVCSAHHIYGGPVPAADVLVVQGLPRGPVSRLFVFLLVPMAQRVVGTRSRSACTRFARAASSSSSTLIQRRDFLSASLSCCPDTVLAVSQVHVRNHCVRNFSISFASPVCACRRTRLINSVPIVRLALCCCGV
jgi:hypothetical protein